MLTRMGLFLLCIALGAILPFLTVTAQSDVSQKAHDLHFSSIVVDTHDDTTQRLLDPKFDFGIRHNDGSIDIPRMREGNLSAIFFSIWISGTITGPEAVKRAMDQIDVVRELPVRILRISPSLAPQTTSAASMPTGKSPRSWASRAAT